MSLAFPTIDPVIFEYGPFAVRWYSLSYVAGILLGWLYIGWLNKRHPKVLSQKAFDDLPIWMVIGVLCGGRLGYVLFYNPIFYFNYPSEIIAVWKGGMSFHGGLIGSIAAIWLFSRHYKLPFRQVADLCACATPIGLFLGRIANFINGELYGRITDAEWGMVFPGDPFTRHPSQLYEAALEGLLSFFILFALAAFISLRQRRGILSGIFLMLYALFRAGVEIVREPDYQIGYIFDIFTLGQLLCAPVFIVGLLLVLNAPPAAIEKTRHGKGKKT